MYDHARREWATEPKTGGFSPLGAVDTLVVHYIGDAKAPITTYDIIAAIRNVYRTHVAGEYSDIAYNAGVDQRGETWELRGMQYQGGATYGANDRTKALLWIGGSQSEPSPLALAAIRRFYLKAIEAKQLAPFATIKGHRDFVPTGCPGDALYGKLTGILSTQYNQQLELPLAESDNDVIDALTEVGTTKFGRFAGIWRPLSLPEYNDAIDRKVRRIEHTGSEIETLRSWGRVI